MEKNAKEHVRGFLRLLGVDRAVFFGALSKVWLAIGGAGTFLIIAFFFSQKLQGYYFTFYSLLSLQVFVEMGLVSVIINFASHEWTNLSLDANGNITGNERSFSRLKSLAMIVTRWFAAGAFVIFLILAVLGSAFFMSADKGDISWFAPWIAFCITSSFSLALVPLIALLEGSNQVANVYFFRFIQEVVRSISTWTIIIAGGALWALPGSSLCIIIWTILFLTVKYRRYFISLIRKKVTDGIMWAKEIWPMQWRLAVSFISGYFFFPLFTPVIFHYQGAVEAGRTGMTLAMTTSLIMISSMWLVTRAPKFGMLISQKKHKEVDSLLIHAGSRAVMVAILGAAAILAMVSALYLIGNPLSQRFLPPMPTVFFLGAAVLMQISLAQSTFLRAHKKEPFMELSAISAVIMGGLTFISAGRWGSLGIAVSYFCVTAFFGIPYGTIVWTKFRKEWRANERRELK